ncbi:ADP-ribosyltransferase [Nocardia sp. NPDC051981]|uniref:ADP-ribosyltransferase n=1 Tax=Nocardia sp. NPDC051981 TaxID=3155417 RepID=UPI00342983D8
MIWKPPAAGALGWLVGMKWPEGNEDLMWGIADDWTGAAKDMRSIDADIDAAIAAVRQAYPTGDGGDKIIAQLSDMRTGNQSIDKLADWFDTIAGTANNTGTQLEYTKLMFYTTLITLAADIAAAWAFPPTAPMAEGAIIGVGRITVRILTRRAIDFLGKEAEKAGEIALKKFILKQVLIGGLMGGLQDGAIQAYQNEFGRRNGIDYKQLGLSAAGGAVGGLIAAPVGKYVPKMLLSPLSKDVAQKMVTQKAANFLGGGVAGGVAGLGGWVVSGGVTHNWEFDPRVVTAGIAGGTLPGVAHEVPSPWKGGEPKLSTAGVKTDGVPTGVSEQHKTPEIGTGTPSMGEQPHQTPLSAENAARDGAPAAEHPQSVEQKAQLTDHGSQHETPAGGPQAAPNAQAQVHNPQVVEARPADGPQAANTGQTPASADPRQVTPAGAPRAETPGVLRTETPAALKPETPVTSNSPRADAPGSQTPQAAEPRATAAPARDGGAALTPMSTRATGQDVPTRVGEHTDLSLSARTAEPAVGRPDGRELVGAGSGPASRIGARPENYLGGREPRPDGQTNHPSGSPTEHNRGPNDQRGPNHPAAGPAPDPTGTHTTPPHDSTPAHTLPRDPEHPVLPNDSPVTEAEHAHARDALDRLGPEATPEHLAHEQDSSVAAAHDRATENHEWWHSLTPEQQDAMLRVHPHELGNADGIPPHVRDEANRLAIARDINQVREQNPRVDKFLTRFTDPESVRQWKNLRSTVEALEHADDLARSFADKNAGHEPPVQVLSYDSEAFGGEGRAVVAFGDTQHASTVSFHVPGITTTVRSLGTNLDNAFNHYRATSENRDPAEVASIAWIGYDAPSGFPKILREMTDARLASRGGQLLARDVAAFSQSRRSDAALPGGSPIPDVHLFGHSYGSTTTAFAGAGGRLSGDISTITLLGSPGAGPVGHAADFGIGAHNIFVASSSRDPVTWIGANTHGEIGRMAPGLGNGLGMDPAISAFGANRIAAQFPGGIHTLSDISTHTGYYNYLDKGATVPTESLHNFARIANGESPHTLPEYPRPGRDDLNAWQRNVGSRPHDPAGFRAPEPNVHQGEHPYGYDDLVNQHRPQDPAPVAPERTHSQVNDCGPQALRQVHELTGNPDVHVPEDAHIADHGMTAAELENAAGAHLDRHETLGSIADQLHRLGDGATALVVDEFHGPTDANDIGAHAYTITNDGGRLVVHDNAVPGGPYPFPPDHTNVKSTHAIVYDSHGNPVHPLERTPETTPANVRDTRPEARIGQPDSRSEPARQGQHPEPRHEPVTHEFTHPTDHEVGGPAHDPIRRFDTPDAARHYGEEILGPIRDMMSGPELRELQAYTKKSWINEFLRAPDPVKLLTKLGEDEVHYGQLMRLTGGSPIMPKIEVLERLLAEHPDPRDPNLDPPLRAAIDSILNEDNPHARLQELWRNSGKLPSMREYFGGDPTMDILRSQVAHLDQATNRPLPEGVEVSRGISMRSLDRLIGPDGRPLNGRNPKLLKGTVQDDHGYMSTSLGPTPPQEFRLKVRMELEVPAGSKGAWVGDKGLSGPENELILQRESRFLITDVIEDPQGARYDDGYVDYLVKGTLVPADYVHEPHVEVTDAHDPNSTTDKPEADPVHPPTDGPDEDHVPFRLGDETQHPVEPVHPQEAPHAEGNGPEHVPTDPADRPSTLTPHLADRFNEMHERIADIAAAYNDPTRTAELPGLRLGLGDLMDKLGMLDRSTAVTAMRLFNEYNPEFANYLNENYKALLPHPSDVESHGAVPTHTTEHPSEVADHTGPSKEHSSADEPNSEPAHELPEAGAPSELTPHEQDALHRYTDPDAGVYADLNKRLRSGADLDPHQAELADHISSALDKLPTFEGTAWRGTNLSPEDLARYVKGATVREPSFTSTSTDRNRIFTGNVEFIMHSTNGREVSPLSARPAEKEILFDRNATFEVRGVVHDPNANLFGVTRIYLVETPSHTGIHETSPEHADTHPSDSEATHAPNTRDLVPEDPPVRYGTDRTSLGDSPEIERVFQNLRNEGEHDVILHGNRFGRPTADGGHEIDPQKVVEAIRNNPDYVPGTPVRLISCHSGNEIGWAQHVAHELGVPVRAPSDLVGVRAHPDSPAVVHNEGTWKTFHPEGPDGRTPEPTVHQPDSLVDAALPRGGDTRDGWDILGNETADEPSGSPHDEHPGSPHDEQSDSPHDEHGLDGDSASSRYADLEDDVIIDSGDPKYNERFVEWNRPSHRPPDPENPHAPRRPLDVHEEIRAPHRDRDNVPDGNTEPDRLRPDESPDPIPEPLGDLAGDGGLHPWTEYPVVNQNGTRTTFFTDGDGVVKWVEATPGARDMAVDGKGKWSGFNPDLSFPLLPDVQYQVPNFHNNEKLLNFHTDEHGQTDRLTGDVEARGQDKNHRDDDSKKGAQKRANQEGEAAFPKNPPGRTLTLLERAKARIKWAGGHLLANELGGLGEYLNMHPQMAASNSGNDRDGWVHAASWRAKENQLVEFASQDHQDIRNYQVKMIREADGVPASVVMRWQEVTYARNSDGTVQLGLNGKPVVESVVTKERAFSNKEANFGPATPYNGR